MKGIRKEGEGKQRRSWKRSSPRRIQWRKEEEKSLQGKRREMRKAETGVSHDGKKKKRKKRKEKQKDTERYK